jgi:hypothetical protein
MTCQPLDAERWRLTFPEPEGYFIISVLARLARHYKQDVAELPPSQRAFWQGSLTTKKPKPGSDLAESQDVLSEARAELRSERQALAENWVRDFELAENRNPWTVDITTSERDEFVAMLNDRRLLLGLELGLTEGEMETSLGEITDEQRRAAVLEIDVLGHFIMVTLGPQFNRP